jgi:hypothetical protein
MFTVSNAKKVKVANKGVKKLTSLESNLLDDSKSEQKS